MPQMSNMKTSRKFAAIGVGDPGSGKTGALAKLIDEMDSLGLERIVISDWDAGTDVLLEYVKKNHDKVFIETLRDELSPDLKNNAEAIVRGSDLPDKSGLMDRLAWVRGNRLMNNWKTKEYDLGRPVSWGLETLYVSDTLTGMGDATRNFAAAILGEDSWRGTGTAMRLQDGHTQLCLSLKCHFILFAHIRHLGGGGKITVVESKQKGGQTSTKEVNSMVDGTAYPSALGKDLPKQIARNFNTMIEFKLKDHGKRVVLTEGSERFALKVPFKLKTKELPQETALLTLFQKLQEG